jgi:uncharacterized membrane protein
MKLVHSALFLFVCTGTVAQAQTQYAWNQIVCSLPSPSGPEVVARALNNKGQVTGSLGNGVLLWENGVATDVTPSGPGITGGMGMAINDATEIAASVLISYSGFTSPRRRAYVIESDGEARPVGPWRSTFAGASAGPAAINSAAHVVGASSSSDQQRPWLDERQIGARFLPDLGGGFAYPTGMNDLDQAVGQSNLAPPDEEIHHAVLWENGKVTDLGSLAAGTSSAYAINNRDQIVGFSTNETDPHRFGAALWENGIIVDISNGFPSVASDINESGVAVGVFSEPGGVQRGFVREGTTLVDLNTRLMSPLPDALHMTWASDINDSGQILAHALNSDSKACTFLLTPAP